jgi:hypothetical protein
VELSGEVLEAEEKEQHCDSAMVLRSEIEKCRRMGLLR